MTPNIDQWQPVGIDELQGHLGSFQDWCLCGGHSLDWLVGRETRPHGDIDVGVLRSDLVDCLQSIGQERVFLCDPPGSLVAWDGGPIGVHVHDIWITDPICQHWIFQVMVYDNNDGIVTYRRDSRITWPASQHTVVHRGLRVLNPAITMLFKLNKPTLEDKDCVDMMMVIRDVFFFKIKP